MTYYTESEWQKEYEKIEVAKDIHRLSFILTKKCKCNIMECRHYETEKNRLFAGKIKELLFEGIMLNAKADFRILTGPKL